MSHTKAAAANSKVNRIIDEHMMTVGVNKVIKLECDLEKANNLSRRIEAKLCLISEELQRHRNIMKWGHDIKSSSDKYSELCSEHQYYYEEYLEVEREILELSWGISH